MPSVPLDSFASANTRPPWASMIDQQIDSPIPTPLDFVPGSSAGSTSTGIVPPDPLAAPPTASTGSPRAASGSKARGVGWEFVHIPSTTPSPSLARETTISALSPFSGQPSLNLRTWTRGSNSRLRSRNGREPAHQAILRLPTRPRLMGRGSSGASMTPPCRALVLEHDLEKACLGTWAGRIQAYRVRSCALRRNTNLVSPWLVKPRFDAGQL